VRPALSFICAAALVGLLTGCNVDKDSAQEPKRPRPVVSVVVKPQDDHPIGFAGTIGDVVAPGQVLAQIDPMLLDLAVRTSEADLAKAQAQLANASAAEGRISTLFAKNVATQADSDGARQALEAATAGVKQAEANLVKAREQRTYATLMADAAGVVTSVDAEIGQMVAAGKKVMTIARTDIREAVVDIPDGAARSLIPGEPFTVRLQADGSVTTTGKVREIAPQAEAVTRTRRVRITLDQSIESFRLGATVTVLPIAPAAAQMSFDIPASALLNRDGAPRVWLVDPTTRTVRAISVQVAEQDDRRARVVGGIATGARIVVAGVNSLSDGQLVKFDERVSP
jgi:RND family efflux transporter MFP subunit